MTIFTANNEHDEPLFTHFLGLNGEGWGILSLESLLES